MGCTSSRATSGSSSSAATAASLTAHQVPRTLSLPTPLIHHPPLCKGDTHHLVSLTSTTYGSLLLIDVDPDDDNPKSNDHHNPPLKTLDPHLHYHQQQEQTLESPPETIINTWELMEGLEESAKPTAAAVVSRSFTFHGTTVNLRHRLETSIKESPKSENSPIKESRKPYLDAFDDDVKVSKKSYLYEANSVPNSPSKPLWKLLSEELVLRDTDPEVVSSFRRHSIFAHSKQRTPASGYRVSPFDSQIRLPGTEDKIVLFFTTLRGIRRTYEDCCTVRSIFAGFRVSVDERDISMDSAYRKELQSVLEEKTISLPQVFIRGRHIGGAEEIKQLHEIGELASLVKGFPIRELGLVCESCGDVRFVPCANCSGSRKVFEEDEGQLRRCLVCNENGLIRCPNCCD